LAAAFTSHGCFSDAVSQNRSTLSVVMPGLDPGIHLLAKTMDRRIKSGDDSEANR
jgi:hypothetical protein